MLTLCISSPGLAPQLTVLSGHAALGSPSRLHRLQDPGLDLSLLWACLANHGNKNGRAVEPFGELVSAPGHGIVHAEFADFFNIRRGEVVFPFGHRLVDTGKIVGIGGRSGRENGSFPNVIGWQEFGWGVVGIWSTRWRVVDNVIVTQVRRVK